MTPTWALDSLFARYLWPLQRWASGGCLRGPLGANDTHDLVPDTPLNALKRIGITTAFIGSPATGPDAATALNDAQAHVRAQTRWREPYYWAGFQLYGDWR